MHGYQNSKQQEKRYRTYANNAQWSNLAREIQFWEFVGGSNLSASQQ